MLGAIGLLFTLAAPGQVPPPNAGVAVSRSLIVQRDAIRAKEQADAKALLAKLDKAVRAEAAGVVEVDLSIDALGPDGATRFRPLPAVIPAVAPSKPGWATDWSKIRGEAGPKYEALAMKALKAEPPRLALAEECLRATVARTPSPSAYRLLGYLPHEGGWATPFAIQQLKDGFVSHPIFGWVKQDWTPHLDKGELPAPYVAGRPTRWLPTAEADELRREWGRGWQISTEHFAITTNVPLAEAISFGNRLEAFFDLFRATMADVIGTEAPLVHLYKNAKLAPAPPRKKHKVFYFADKEEYVRHLLPLQGESVTGSLGTYIPPRLARPKGNSASYFFREVGGQLDVTATLYHEVSHQLLFELAGKDGYDDGRPSFWVFEGLGTYFETVTPRADGIVEVGGLVGPRLEQAKDRLVKNREFIPIGRFVGYNKNLFNSDGDGDIYLHYAQSMALTVYLMQVDDRAFREGFLDHVRDVYKGRTSKGLEDRVGKSFAEMNKGLVEYLGRDRPKAP